MNDKYESMTREDLIAQINKLTSALERLGSMETFTYSRIVAKVRDAELLARIDYARE